MNILFINSSPNRNGNTARIAAALLDGKEYETLNLVDCKIYAYGQSFPDTSLWRSLTVSARPM